MTRYHQPNPLDAVFLAIDDAWRRGGLAGMDIHLHLEFRGRVDVAGIERALRALRRVWPATNARLVRRPFLRRFRWRLDAGESRDADIVDVQELDGDEAAFERYAEDLLATQLDVRRAAPLRLYVARMRDGNDRMIVRWPHALMDARGGATIVEELARLYDERPTVNALCSAGDELRRDFGTLDGRMSLRERAAAVWGALGARRRSAAARELRLCPLVNAEECGRMRICIRRLDRDDAARVRDAAMQVCGFGRFADFLRAAAIRALAETVASRDPDGVFSTMHLLDNRRRRDRGPVCHNVFSAFPIHIPAAVATDRAVVADLIRDATVAVLHSGALNRRLAGLRLLARIPSGLLSRSVSRGLRLGRSFLPLGVSNPPSLPMGFMGPLSRAYESMFGATLVNIYGVRPASPPAGFALNVNQAQGRMNIAGIHYESSVPAEIMQALVDRFVTALTEPLKQRIGSASG